MPSLGSKKDVQKRDLNFFAEFTANAARMTRLLGYFVVFGLIVVALIVGVIIWGIIRNTIAQSQIDELNAVLASDEYKNLDAEAQELQQQLTSYNNYYYALSQMRGQVDTTHSVSMNLTDAIKKAIPSDSYVDKYSISQTGMHIEGYTFSYYSALNMVKLLNGTDLFSAPVLLKISRVDPSKIGSTDTFISPDGKVNAINNYYSFVVDGTLTSDVYVSVSKLYRKDANVISLGPVERVSFKQGDTYEFSDIAKVVQGNVTYQLSGVTINNSSLAQDTVNNIAAAGKITGTAYSSDGTINIQLYYSLVENNAEGGNT